jgi:SpoVK/Ycf46/Vps4 family AAA+-type ATPase
MERSSSLTLDWGSEAVAASELIQELIRAHVARDESRFRKVALQIAASESRAGHRLVAGRIRDLLEQEPETPTAPPTPIARPQSDLREILAVAYPKFKLGDIVLDEQARSELGRVLQEQRSRGRLEEWGLLPRRKLLFFGPPGNGKTFAAHVLAGELGLPLVRLRIEVLFSRFLGETSALLTGVFDEMRRIRGVFLFDEFDAIGKHRGDLQDVGELNRIVATFLQLLDVDESDSLVVAGTNQRRLLDPAINRRFDDVVCFPPPTSDQIKRLVRLRLPSTGLAGRRLTAIAGAAEGMSFADVAVATTDALKVAILDGREQPNDEDLLAALSDRRKQSE